MGFGTVIAVMVLAAAAWYVLLVFGILRHIDRKRFEGTLWRAENLSQGLAAARRLSSDERSDLSLALARMADDYGLLRGPDRRRYDPRLTRMYVLAASNGIDCPPPGR